MLDCRASGGRHARTCSVMALGRPPTKTSVPWGGSDSGSSCKHACCVTDRVRWCWGDGRPGCVATSERRRRAAVARAARLGRRLHAPRRRPLPRPPSGRALQGGGGRCTATIRRPVVRLQLRSAATGCAATPQLQDDRGAAAAAVARLGVRCKRLGRLGVAEPRVPVVLLGQMSHSAVMWAGRQQREASEGRARHRERKALGQACISGPPLSRLSQSP